MQKQWCLINNTGLIPRQMSYLLRWSYRNTNPVKKGKRLLMSTKGTPVTRNKDDLLLKWQPELGTFWNDFAKTVAAHVWLAPYPHGLYLDWRAMGYLSFRPACFLNYIWVMWRWTPHREQKGNRSVEGFCFSFLWVN